MPSSLSTEQSHGRSTFLQSRSSISPPFLLSGAAFSAVIFGPSTTKWFLIIVPFWHLSSTAVAGYFLLILSSTRFAKLDHPDSLRNESRNGSILLLYTGIPLYITPVILSPTTTSINLTTLINSAKLLSHTGSSSPM